MDNNEAVELELSAHELLTFALLAHHKNMTLNEWMLEKLRRNTEGMDNETQS